ncbi:DUF6807 family protein [Microbacterium aurantiacum]|uniref:DUF6807 family protein n=1 Tax=Microbacterium aurantiacum TaxID=162393 RepID=UPI000C7FB13D|nr:DUF6807 family protein [Microbacterium aurantiacum]
MVTDVLLVGARGFGAVHLRNLERLGDRVRVVALADPSGAPEDGFGADAPAFPGLAEAFAAGIRPDVVIVATPTGTHFALAALALEHGCDLYLEKPPVATMEQFEDLLALQEHSGRAVQIGFQSFGSHAFARLAELGEPTSVAAWGAWTRDAAYWTRSAWAGRRSLDGLPVVDGVVTNPLSHAVATALRLAGARRREDVALIELELYRANDIEADDTSSVRVTLSDGRIVSAALTLAAPEQSDPLIEVRTPGADVVFSYTTDRLEYPDGQVEDTGRTDLFEELLDHRDRGIALTSPLVEAGAFMTVMEAVRTAPDPILVPDAERTVLTDRPAALTTIDGVAFWAERTARAGALFSELHAPFASAPQSGRTRELRAGSSVVAVHDDGSAVARTSGPRPFLHPVRTPGGTVVTDAHPADHDWHLGASVALQHVNGVNFWGGPTYVRDQGYRWLDNAGRIRVTSFAPRDDGFDVHAEWVAPDGGVLLEETTAWHLRPSSDPRAWLFRTTTTLRAAGGPVELGSPGSNGRSGGGYGGFTWRFPTASDVDVRTPDAHGEESVHGSVSAWLAFSARFTDGEATVAVAGDDLRTRSDPWFVRVADYPGIGSALAWSAPVRLDEGEHVRLSFRGAVADGRLTDAEVVVLLGE